MSFAQKMQLLQNVFQITAVALASVINNYAGTRGVMVGGARGVIVIVVRNGHGNTSSNPGRH